MIPEEVLAERRFLLNGFNSCFPLHQMPRIACAIYKLKAVKYWLIDRTAVEQERKIGLEKK